jgi:hypothetical protein
MNMTTNPAGSYRHTIMAGQPGIITADHQLVDYISRTIDPGAVIIVTHGNGTSAVFREYATLGQANSAMREMVLADDQDAYTTEILHSTIAR